MPYNEALLQEMLAGDHGVDHLDLARALISATDQIGLLTSERNSSILESQKRLEALEQVIFEREELRGKLTKMREAISGLGNL